MKFGRIISTLESQGSLLNTDKVVAINEEVQGTDPEPATPAGVSEENIQPNPAQTEAEQASEVVEVADPEADKEVVAVTQGDSDNFDTPAEMLDEIQQVGNEAAANNGGVLTKFEANAIQTSVESIMSSIGMDVPSMPTMEAHTSTWSGKEAARLTMESVLTSAKAIGKKIIDGMKAMLEYTINFLVGLVKNRALMEKNIERLIAKAKAIKPNWQHREDQVSGRFVHGLSSRDKSDVATLHSILGDSVDLITYYGFANEMLREIRDGSQPANLINKLASAVTDNAQQIGKASPTTENDVYLYGNYAGGMSIGIVRDDRGEDSIRFISNSTKARTKNPTMAAEDPSTVIDALESALILIRTIRKIEGTVNRVSDMVKALIRRVEGEYYNLRGNLGSNEYANKAKANKDARDAQEIMRRMIVRMPSMAFSAVKNTADWASAQINNYRE